MADVDLLRKELQYITDHPEAWLQETWLSPDPNNGCGSVGCLAGNAAIHAGRAILKHDGIGEWYEADHPSGDFLVLGAELFDISEDEATWLFEGDNSLLDLWVIARDITRGEIQIPAELDETAEQE